MASHLSEWPSPLTENLSDFQGEEWPVSSVEEGKTFPWFKDTNQLLIRTITWNLHAKDPPSIEILREKLLPLNKFHILFFTSQECDHTIAQSTVLTSKAKWEGILKEAIGPSYSLLCSHTLQAIHTILFVHSDLLFATKLVSSQAIPTGIGNTLGNKGGIGTLIEVATVPLLFVGSHLAAGQSETSTRNEHYHRIYSELNRILASSTSTEEEDKGGDEDLVARFPFVFWAGDLNYRVSSDRSVVDMLLARDRWDVLVAIDQLKNEREAGAVFQGFEEGPLHFRPTYKFDSKSEVYDTSPKQRVPSWTDRVLYKPSESLMLRAYDSVSEIQTSDHRPVFASFLLDVGSHLPDESKETPDLFWKDIKVKNAVSRRKERKPQLEGEEGEEGEQEGRVGGDEDNETVHTYEYEYLTDQSSSQVCVLS